MTVQLFLIGMAVGFIVAMAVGVVVAVGAQAATAWPGFAVWWQTAVAGVLLGLAACGLFDVGQAIKGKFL